MRAATVALLLLVPVAAAQEIIIDVDAPSEDPEPAIFHMPYAFYSATWELAFGYAAVATGQLQDQLSLFANAIVSTNETRELQVGMYGAQIPGTDRVFGDGFLSLGTYTELRAYIGEEDGTRSGSNESGQDNFVQDTAVQIWGEARFRFILPLGPGRAEPIQTYRLRRGILEGPGTGGKVWNPLTSGRTSIGLRPFYRRQEFDLAAEGGKLATNGLAYSLEYDNRDFPRNPSYGSRQVLTFWQDFGALDSTTSWTSLEFQASKYIDLGETSWARQQVIAIGGWTADSPSWSDDANGAGAPENAPPYFMGATLGGRSRLRAYPANRFNDRAGVHYWAEYRMIPGWQPLPSVSELDVARIDWWQIVFFAELGRVAPAWSFEQLHEDMKWDVGASLRIFARKALVRIDFAVGPEEWAVLIDLSHPF